MTRISGINQLGHRKLRFQVYSRSGLFGREGLERTEGMTRISSINQLGHQKLKFQVSSRSGLFGSD